MNQDPYPGQPIPQGPQVPPITKRHPHYGQLIALIVLCVLFIIAGAFAVWSYRNYLEASSDLEAKIDQAVVDAKKKQSDIDEKQFAEREKLPVRKFASPDDLGRVSFSYPKTWSVYESTPRTGTTYKVYFHPTVVPTLAASSNKYAMRLTILQGAYDDYVKSYEKLVKDGKITSSAVSAGGVSGTRFDGDFNDKLRGSVVLFKIRDKVLIIRTDLESSRKDFDSVIKTLSFKS